ncbi:hypothetical protein N1C26_000483 [Cronobacter sakazakii]|uniref:hypothetical protein n=1 Tax=Cronobacter sakazakii TaxID=28141 RepID=UPI0015E327EB|nr:hypothetical protein [Cronobacter sakazakii]EJQ2006720.1 hypothetical protein [Cronobacter sakazakii]EJQ2087371.1 hypothetical protein [Cronobacter sakazakii]EJR9309033.1 hypothetical protein [Cronobacter sakazakii]EJR9313094.1 hypothetical protein [Cronobacter sakazakii]EJR9313716.1 hypothetical protein [Cronobacter sakazakii]
MMPYIWLKHVLAMPPLRLLLRVNIPLTLTNLLQTVVIVMPLPELLNALFRLFSISFKNEIVLIAVEPDG